jgi:putative FmdB family regulatory protein
VWALLSGYIPGTGAHTRRATLPWVPLNEFACDACGARFEELTPPGGMAPCPACGGEDVRRVFAPIAARGPGVALTGKAARESDARRSEREAAKKERFVADRKRKRGQGPPGG